MKKINKHRFNIISKNYRAILKVRSNLEAENKELKKQNADLLEKLNPSEGKICKSQFVRGCKQFGLNPEGTFKDLLEDKTSDFIIFDKLTDEQLDDAKKCILSGLTGKTTNPKYLEQLMIAHLEWKRNEEKK